MNASTVSPIRRRWTLLAVVIGALFGLWLTAASLTMTQRSATSQPTNFSLPLAGPSYSGGGGG